MKVLVVADSAFGNTWAVANAIGEVLGPGARVVHSADVVPSDLDGLDLLVVGSPTQGGRPLASMTAMVRGLPHGALKGVRTAAFDTRVSAGSQGVFLKALINVIGYAAPKIDRALSKAGGRQVVAPEGFIVDGKAGPLHDGELERARRWVAGLIAVAGR